MEQTDGQKGGESAIDETDSLYWIKRLRETSEDIFLHSYRVASVAELMGEKLELSDKELGDLRRGCFLHDIGKVMIPPDVLHKTGPLSDGENMMLELHPVLGELIVSTVEGLGPDVWATVGSHHERWDGAGYPNRLKGERIPLYARICRIADAFDHLLLERTVHKRKALEEAKSQLKQGSNQEFDAYLISIFLTLTNEMLSIYSL
ncbi:HD-GYP domain-containing protein [Paenibacillus physcomitrellae]|uniref:HD-GYP domain-containing protein n=1 Tax=Paenibacillus physcomitrellae TaxID=1619311 RepID=A0ABQ1GKU0_9BACL|nr:HD domain-containing phosphohydrolase [Paenibacillus physcomitrellae]GGA45794.1 hypothetical protein GCM10010917_33900 [Paenibacillus physcomitrellae]